MPRQARLDAPGTLHHVMIRGIERTRIFRDEKDREYFLLRTGQTAQRMETRIIAWALMDNHVHILLFSGSAGLPAFMRRLLTGYAVQFNRRHKRSGHLFQNRYKSIVCQEDQYLLELVRYIHLNPLRAQAVSSMEELDRYGWSGHAVILGNVGCDWQERKYVLSQFGREERHAIAAYRGFMEEGRAQGRRPDLVGGGLLRSVGGWSRVISLREQGEKVEYDDRILGSGDFVQEVIREAEDRISRQVRKRSRQPIEETISRMCKERDVTESEIRSGSMRRKVSKARAEIACYLSREIGTSLAEIARRLGVGASAIAMAIRRTNPD